MAYDHGIFIFYWFLVALILMLCFVYISYSSLQCMNSRPVHGRSGYYDIEAGRVVYVTATDPPVLADAEIVPIPQHVSGSQVNVVNTNQASEPAKEGPRASTT
jgi:hypothetical protein